MIEILWGTSYTSGLNIVDGTNMVDSAFNDLVGIVEVDLLASLTFDVVDNTALTIDADIDYVECQYRGFSDLGLGTAVVLFEIYDGTTWSTLQTFSETGTPFPLTNTTLPYNVSATLNTVAKINASQFRFTVTSKKNNQHFHVDGVRLIVTSKNKVSVFDSATAVEDLSLNLDVLNIDQFDSISIAEDISAYLDVLNFNVAELSGLLITEHTDIVDLVVEVGVVADFISETCFAEMSLDVLYISVAEELTITEAIDVLDTIVELGIVWDDVSVSDDVTVLMPELNIDVAGAVGVEEDISASLDVLYLDVYEFSGLLVTEHADVVDLIVEVGVVADFIHAYDDDIAFLSLDVLNISVNDAVVVSEFANLLDIVIELGPVVDYIEFQEGHETVYISLDALFIDVYDTTVVTEAVSILDIIVDVGIVADAVAIAEDVSVSLDSLNAIAGDDISITENSSVTLPTLNVSVDDGASITESIQLLDIVIDLGVVYDDVSVAESTNLELSGFAISVWDGVTVEEYVNLLDIVIELFGYDEIYVESDTSEGPPIVDIYLDVLNVFTLDPFHVLITEVASVLDLIIEVGVVAESITVLDGATALLDVLNLSVADAVSIEEDYASQTSVAPAGGHDNITVDEDVAIGLDQLFLAVQEPVGVVDVAIMTDLVIELGPVIENISVVDLGGPTLGELLISVGEDINIEEWAVAFDPVIELSAGDDIGVTEDISILIPILYVSVEENIGLTESVSVLDIIIEVGIVVDLIGVTEFTTIQLGELIIFAVENIVSTEYVEVLDIAFDLPLVWADVSAEEFAGVSLDELSVFVASAVTVLDYGTVFDPVIELFVAEDLSVSEVVITPFGVIVGEDTFVNGALFDNILTAEAVDVILPYLLVSVYEEIMIEEWATVFDITIELGPVVEDISVEDIFSTPYIPSDIFVWDEITYTEYSIAGYPLELIVTDDIIIVEYELVLQQAYDLYPRIYEVCPRPRIFIRNKRKVRL